MHPFENGYVFQPLDPSPNNKAELSLVFTDLELNQIGDIGLKSPPHPFPLNLGKRFTLLNTGELIYRRVLSEGAFLVDLNHLTPYLNFDYGNDWIWKNPKNTSSIKVASKAIFGEKGFFEVIPNFSESFITFTFYHSNRTTTKGILDRSTKKYFNLRVRKSDRSVLEMNFIKWENHRLVASMHTSELENILSNLNPNQYIIRGNLPLVTLNIPKTLSCLKSNSKTLLDSLPNYLSHPLLSQILVGFAEMTITKEASMCRERTRMW